MRLFKWGGVYNPKYTLIYITDDKQVQFKSKMTSMDIFDFVEEEEISRDNYAIIEGKIIKDFDSP